MVDSRLAEIMYTIMGYHYEVGVYSCCHILLCAGREKKFLSSRPLEVLSALHPKPLLELILLPSSITMDILSLIQFAKMTKEQARQSAKKEQASMTHSPSQLHPSCGAAQHLSQHSRASSRSSNSSVDASYSPKLKAT